eukprot:TRINITY_DN13155_c1_g1_i1.p1 TRINITY_DN13155_c1_g1~~TRINITY_DN13155_c1_g1_i1.p1  ORF type:complete len:218 (-),score=41.23 TRINITY_DN13155_c1_g1_i1:68-721(-)
MNFGAFVEMEKKRQEERKMERYQKSLTLSEEAASRRDEHLEACRTHLATSTSNFLKDTKGLLLTNPASGHTLSLRLWSVGLQDRYFTTLEEYDEEWPKAFIFGAKLIYHAVWLVNKDGVKQTPLLIGVCSFSPSADKTEKYFLLDYKNEDKFLVHYFAKNGDDEFETNRNDYCASFSCPALEQPSFSVATEEVMPADEYVVQKRDENTKMQQMFASK